MMMLLLLVESGVMMSYDRMMDRMVVIVVVVMVVVDAAGRSKRVDSAGSLPSSSVRTFIQQDALDILPHLRCINR